MCAVPCLRSLFNRASDEHSIMLENVLLGPVSMILCSLAQGRPFDLFWFSQCWSMLSKGAKSFCPFRVLWATESGNPCESAQVSRGGNHQAQGKQIRFLKRTMVAKNGKNTVLIVLPSKTATSLRNS